MSCLVSSDTMGMVEFESNLTVGNAMNGVLLRNMDKQLGKKNIVKAIAYFIQRLSNNFNVGKKLDPTQASILALDLFEIFSYESLEDVMMMFKLARQGKIGDGRDYKLDGQTVLHKWVPAYLELKAVERENQHQKTKDVGKAANNPLHRSILKDAGNEKPDFKKGGLGSRKKDEISTPEGYVPPIQKRETYLSLLRDTAIKTETEKLEINLQQLIDDNGKPDEIAVLENELARRGYKNKSKAV